MILLCLMAGFCWVYLYLSLFEPFFFMWGCIFHGIGFGLVFFFFGFDYNVVVAWQFAQLPRSLRGYAPNRTKNSWLNGELGRGRGKKFCLKARARIGKIVPTPFKLYIIKIIFYN